ncbi:MAG TPA: hypothetical protein VFE22_15045 [Edaphobacter sp.]|nr:hypothetical protein [Edaphobacter sp.]
MSLSAVVLLAGCARLHARQSVSGGASAPAVDADTQTPMTKDQAKELFRSVDTILKFVSSDTQLPIEHPVKRKLISRDQVNRYLTKKFDEDESTKRLERSEIVLKKFGLLDRDFNLRPFLVSLLTEQIAGFYDNQTKTVNLLNWIPPDQQKPVLAHELTHALQDQRVGLTKWSDVSLEGTSRDAQEDNRHLEVDEANTARDAVAEGQAMAVFVDYTLRPSGRTLAEAPELSDRLNDLIADSSGSPMMSRAPLLLQQSLLFPYSAGLSFEQAILVKKGIKAAFADVLAKPPSSSFEIMNPKAYMAHTPVPALRLPDIHPLLEAEYTPYDVGVMGELDVRILAELFGGRQIASALAPAWDGGIYYAARRRSAVTAEEKASTASIGLLYYSRWKNADSARSFLRIYASQIPRKYSGVVRRSNDEAGAGGAEEQVYSTNEGDVLLSISGESVFISEGFELPLARRLRDRIAGGQPQGPLQVARAAAHGTTPGHELSLGLARTLSSFGMIRAGIAQRYTLEGDPDRAP